MITSAMDVRALRPGDVRQPTSSASRVARSSWRLVIVTVAPRLISPKAMDRATPPAPRISTCLSSSGLASFDSLARPPMPSSSESIAAR